jgi:O-antigen/teichoic acid export membrane protein
LTSVRLLARNTVWNLLGQALPLLVALLAIPYLVAGLGTSRFGVLTLAWMVIGYFSLFDLGLGRALTKLVAEKLGSSRDEQIPRAVWTALSMMLGFGILGAALAALATPWLVGSGLEIPEALRVETLIAFYISFGNDSGRHRHHRTARRPGSASALRRDQRDSSA